VSRLAELDFDERDGVLVVRITGELDLSNVHDIGDALTLAPTARGLVLDLSELTHLDSAGVRLVFDLRARLAKTRQRIALVVPAESPIREVIELAAVRATVPVHDGMDAAVADVAGH
jgi:anti-anti-sigma factor